MLKWWKFVVALTLCVLVVLSLLLTFPLAGTYLLSDAYAGSIHQTITQWCVNLLILKVCYTKIETEYHNHSST